MEIFKLTLNQMVMMFAIILLGCFLRKVRALPENSGNVMSLLETCVFLPTLSLYNMINKCTPENFAENWTLILLGFGITLTFVLLSDPLSRLFIKKSEDSVREYQRKIYQYALTTGNYGFMGNFIVLGVFGEDAFFKYSLFTLGIGLFVNSWGLYILVPKDKGAGLLQNIKKGLLKPPLIALFAGIILGLLRTGQYIPQFLDTALKNCGNCQGPVAMLLAGFIIGGYNFKELITNKKVYGASFMRLILIPAVIVCVLRLFGTTTEIMALVLIAFATPLGLNTIVFPAAYGGDTKTGASMATISHTLSVLTIPIMYYLMIELMPKVIPVLF